MAVRHYFSHKECDGKNRSQQHEMLHSVGVNWNDYPDYFKRGSYIRRVTVETMLTPDELSHIPEDRRPNGPVIRSKTERIPMDPIQAIENRVDVLFGSK
jgi:tRNA(His) 5'-end guanylyltransferase